MFLLNPTKYLQKDVQPATSTARNTTILDLPDKVLMDTFSYLDIRQRCRCERVCKRWRQVIAQMCWCYPAVVFNPGDGMLTIENCSNLQDDHLCFFVSRGGRKLEKLRLSTTGTDLTEKSLTKIGRYCPNLKEVWLRIKGLELMCLKNLAVGCPRLKIVDIDSDEHEGHYKSGVFMIAKNCRNLQCLRISRLVISANLLGVVNPYLKILYLSGCKFTNEAMQRFTRRCYALQELAIDDCEYLEKQNIFFNMLRNFRRTLTILRVASQLQLLEWHLVLKVMINLEILQLFCCFIVDDMLMDVLSKKCRKLRFLDISYSKVTDTGLMSLRDLPNLKQLKIFYPKYIVGYGLEALIAHGTLEQVTISSSNSALHSAFRSMEVLYPNVEFIVVKQDGDEEQDWDFESESD